jgi:class 3 adenylate cyclase
MTMLSIEKSHRLQLEHRSIIVIDIAGSARWHNKAQLHARDVLAAAIHTAVSAAGIATEALAIEDRGDGMILLIPASVSKIDILDPLIPCLAEQIDIHNTVAGPALRIQLRVAVHAGEVHRDAYGWVGSDLNTACRLVNGTPLYQQLAGPLRPAVVVVVSDLIYQGVVRHHYDGIDPADYTPIRVEVKETDTSAWLHTPHSGFHPAP